MVYAIVAMGVLLAIVIVMAKVHDLRKRRETEALALQSRLSDTLMTDRSLQGMTVSPTVHAPVLRSAPLKVSVTGEVPNEDVHAMVLRRIQAEVAQAGREVEVEDRLMVLAPARAA